MTKIQIAKSLCHILCGFKVSIGEKPYPDWEETPVKTQQFLIGAVDVVKGICYWHDDHEIRCKEIHDYWMNWAIDNDPEHASLIPYSELSETEKIKDGLVINSINAMLPYLTDE